MNFEELAVEISTSNGDFIVEMIATNGDLRLVRPNVKKISKKFRFLNFNIFF